MSVRRRGQLTFKPALPVEISVGPVHISDQAAASPSPSGGIPPIPPIPTHPPIPSIPPIPEAFTAPTSSSGDEVVTHNADGSSVKIGKDGVIVIQGTPKHHSSMSTSSGLSDAVPIVAIVFCFGWLSIKAIVNAFAGRASNRQSARLSAEEQALVERLQRTIAQMESRIESLETILVETRRSTQSQSYGTKF